MSEKNKKILESYGRHFLVAAIAVWTAKGLSVENLFDVVTLQAMLNAGLAAVVGPLVKHLKKGTPAIEVVVEPAKKAPAKKAVAKRTVK
jgi:hypothetical protein